MKLLIIPFTFVFVLSFATANASMRLVNVATGNCLDSNHNGDVYAMTCNGGDFQRWIRSGTWRGATLQNVATGRCLDSNSKRDVYALPCSGSHYQIWVRNDRTMRNGPTGLFLDSSYAGKVYTLRDNGGNHQNWNIQE